MAEDRNFDVIIIGGSYAGLSAAMSLGRSQRKVLVIDSGLPCNRQTPHSHNFLTQDGATPQEISSLARQQVKKYPTVQFHEGLATGVKKMAAGFEVSIQNISQSDNGEDSGIDSNFPEAEPKTVSNFFCKKLILATGIKDEFPDIPGLIECWGISVVHCPYCHGYEFRNVKTAIMANGESAYHLATLVKNLTHDITVLTTGTAAFTKEQFSKLEQHHIQIVETKISAILHQNGHLESVMLEDGNHMDFMALYASVPFSQPTPIPEQLGCELTDRGYIKVDSLQKTNIPGVYACGDNTSAMRSVANAVAAGNLTGGAVNKELTEEQF